MTDETATPGEEFIPNPDFPVVQTDNGARPEDGDQSDVEDYMFIEIDGDFDHEGAGDPTRAKLLNICVGYLGVREVPDGSNRTVIGEKFGWNGVAWCQEFDCVCEGEAGMTPFKTASTMEAVAQARKKGTWHDGTAGIRPGDSVYFHWPESSRPKNQPDHVGRVKAVLGPNDLITIEGNYHNQVGSVHRRSNILGYERHAFNDAPAPAKKPSTAKPRQPQPLLRRGSTGGSVRTLQAALNKAGAKLVVDGSFGMKTDAAVRAFQKRKRLVVDGVVGPKTWKALGY